MHHPMRSEVAPAQRSRRSRWRDLRVLGGVALMALAVLAGSFAVVSADDTVPVVAARHDLRPGVVIRAADLEVRRVRFADAAARDRYLHATTDVPAGSVSSRQVGAGELVPRAALARAEEAAPRTEVPLSVAVDDVPVTVRTGSVVDVWVLPEQGAGRARRVLDGVTVLRIAGSGDALAPRATRQVVIGLPGGAGDGGSPVLEQALGRIAGGRVLLTRQG
ncbi:MAG: SAF domain-containing protein [Marmoricola sp.]